MQYVLSEEEMQALIPKELLDKERKTSNEYHRRLSAFGMAVNEHPDSEKIWKRQREILERAEASDTELFNASAMLLTGVDYGKAEYSNKKEKQT